MRRVFLCPRDVRLRYHARPSWALSSAVERLLYTERVGGSIPSAPTIQRGRVLRCQLQDISHAVLQSAGKAIRLSGFAER